MKRSILFLLLSFFVFNCDNSDTSDSENVADEYYVKYILDTESIYSGGNIVVTIKNENNEDITTSIVYNQGLETIIGPVEFGFNANMSAVATTDTQNRLSYQAEIKVSKNDSPFALKEINSSDDPRDSVTISYTIDY